MGIDTVRCVVTGTKVQWRQAPDGRLKVARKGDSADVPKDVFEREAKYLRRVVEPAAVIDSGRTLPHVTTALHRDAAVVRTAKAAPAAKSGKKAGK